MSIPLDDISELIGRTIVIQNADSDFLNVVDAKTGERFWIEATGGRFVILAEVARKDAAQRVEP